jgi:hypothetical protein
VATLEGHECGRPTSKNLYFTATLALPIDVVLLEGRREVAPLGLAASEAAARWNWSQWRWRAVGRLISSTLQPAAFRGLGVGAASGADEVPDRGRMMAGN